MPKKKVTKDTNVTEVTKEAKVAEVEKPAASQAVAKPEVEKRLYHFAVGRRKTASAKIKLFPRGKGEIVVNEKILTDYFKEPNFSATALQPLTALGKEIEFDIKAKVTGGGKHAQAEAVRHGIARALVGFDNELRTTLKKSGFLTRDARAKERKKYGLKRARKGPQFSKR